MTDIYGMHSIHGVHRFVLSDDIYIIENAVYLNN